MIGIIAGVGPFAGLDLYNKILSQTKAAADQDHLGIISWSEPQKIPDRTEYLLGREQTNPAGPIVEQLLKLEQAGATVAGIPCNTAHAPLIFTAISAGLEEAASEIRLLHMIHEVGYYLRREYPDLQRLGVLSTTGTRQSRIYPLSLAPLGFEILVPDEEVQREKIHPAIYDPEYGIKARGQVTIRARQDLLTGVKQLQEGGSEAVILGCTEIPLAIQEQRIGDLIVVDPALILARALIAAVDPAKLNMDHKLG